MTKWNELTLTQKQLLTGKISMFMSSGETRVTKIAEEFKIPLELANYVVGIIYDAWKNSQEN